MTDEVLAPILTLAILAALALWVPTLHLCNARCQSWLTNLQRRRGPGSMDEPAVSREIGKAA